MCVTIIAAVSEDGCIGVDGKLPWRLADDLKRFRERTMGKPVIMGRKTWESLPMKPLPGRLNIVLSRAQLVLPGAVCCSDLRLAVAVAKGQGADEVMVIGGGEVYAQALPLASRLEITLVATEVPDGDAFFPAIEPEGWVIAAERFQPGNPSATYRTYHRR